MNFIATVIKTVCFIDVFFLFMCVSASKSHGISQHDLIHVSSKALTNLNPHPPLSAMGGEVSTVRHFVF